jgi:hypothetical protein
MHLDPSESVPEHGLSDHLLNLPGVATGMNHGEANKSVWKACD